MDFDAIKELVGLGPWTFVALLAVGVAIYKDRQTVTLNKVIGRIQEEHAKEIGEQAEKYFDLSDKMRRAIEEFTKVENAVMAALAQATARRNRGAS